MKSLLTFSLLALALVAHAQEVKIVGAGGSGIPANSRVVVHDDGKYVDMLTKQLSLTPPQVKKVKAIHAEWAKKLGNASGGEAIKKVFAWQQDEIRKILTPAQAAKFKSSGQIKFIKK